jgi:hypothetical protein
MTRKTWDTWGIGTIVALLTGVPLMLASIYLGAWITGSPIKHPLSLGWLLAGIHQRVPLWFTLPVIAFAAVIFALYLHLRTLRRIERAASSEAQRTLVETQLEHAAALSRLQQPQPRLHGVWNNTQTFWHMGRKAAEPLMQIGGSLAVTQKRPYVITSKPAIESDLRH